MKTAILFAGQGSQHTGMGKDLYERFPAFREVFDNANLPFDLKKMCFENPDDLLLQTQYTQPCLVAFATGVSRVLKDSGILCDYAAGLSLGEYSALAHAEVLPAEAAIELTAFRGKAMADAAKGISSGMTAILNLDEKDIQDCCNQASSAGIVSICNYNCPGQIVIGGEKKAVDQASTLAMEKGARRCIPLSVSGPFHTSLMHPAGEALKERFRTEPFAEEQISVLFNCLGDLNTEGIPISDLLVRQVQSPVRMEQTIRKLFALGVTVFIEVGPGRAISGFVKKTAKALGQENYRLEALETVEEITSLLQDKDLRTR